MLPTNLSTSEMNPSQTLKFFSGVDPSPTDVTGAAASTIVPDAHTPPSGVKQHTKPFYPANMKEMAKKDKIDTTPAPNAPTGATADASSLSTGFTVSNSPYSLRNHNFSTSSISNPKPSKTQKRQIMIKSVFTIPMTPNIFHYFTKGLRPIPWLESIQLPIFSYK